MNRIARKGSSGIRFQGVLDEVTSKKLRLVAANSGESVFALVSRVVKAYVDRKFNELTAELKELGESK